jgi:hypothetical protein
MHHDPYWKLLLRRRRNRSHGIAGGHGILPLPLVPIVVGRTRQCLQPLETGSRADHVRIATCHELRVRDGLPKLKDFPAEFGGSGEALAE